WDSLSPLREQRMQTAYVAMSWTGCLTTSLSCSVGTQVSVRHGSHTKYSALPFVADTSRPTYYTAAKGSLRG
ncbi:hypothetical protein N9B17_03180, partial [Rhodopirellula sp.]|nr:hypothetical protein [Rhodopirellula sp.]